MSCQLTKQQRRQIEENRQRALAKRNGKASASQPENLVRENATSVYCDSKTERRQELYNSSTKDKQSISDDSRKPQLLNSKSSLVQQPSGSSQCLSKRGCQDFSVKNKDKFYACQDRMLRGKCVLISMDRFAVEIGYHNELIEYFKQMETRSYDASSRTWSFSLGEYEKLMKGAAVFQPSVQVEGLPPVILETFMRSRKDDGIPEGNLSRVDEKLVNTLLPFQKEGAYFGIHHEGRLLLADDMGLGKTLQALCIACYYRSEWPLLIVSPSSVRYDWARQTCQWIPSVDPQEVNVVNSGKADITRCSVTIISYDLLSKKAANLKGRFRVIIMDESHFLKNFKAVRTKAAMSIVKPAKRVILLSGTPALSRPSELYPQISCVRPSMFKFHDFGLRYCNAKQLPWGWDYSGSSNMTELQLLLEKKIMIRRQKKDVLSQLPTKTRQVVVLSPDAVTSHSNLKKAYKIMNGTRLKGVERRGVLLEYFHETCKAKLCAVRDYVLDLVDAEKKFLVFAHHQEMLDNIEEAVAKRVSYIRIDGKTTSEQRSFFCRKFQKSDDYKVAILSITAANAGLNLSAASLVIFAELFWNPGILVQAEDRVHRIGQENAVSIQYLMAQHTADDFVWPLVQDKLSVLSKAGLTRDNFSEADTMRVADIWNIFNRNLRKRCVPSPFITVDINLSLVEGVANLSSKRPQNQKRMDKSQKKIFDMFTEELSQSDDVLEFESEVILKEENPSPSHDQTSPSSLLSLSKRKRKKISHSSTDSSPDTPSKRQMNIKNYFSITPPSKAAKGNGTKSLNHPCKQLFAESSDQEHERQVVEHDTGMNTPTYETHLTGEKNFNTDITSNGKNKDGSLSLSQEDIKILSEVDWDEEF